MFFYIFFATFLFLIDAGPIVTNDYFGFANITAFEATGGVDIALAKSYGLRIGLDLAQYGLAFKRSARGVTGATDRVLGLAATFEVLY